MKVRDIRKSGSPHYEEIMVVYGVYWLKDGVYFYCSPKQYNGLMSFSENDVEIVEPLLNQEFVFRRTVNGMGFYHHLIATDDLGVRLLDYDPEAYAYFKKKLGHEP